MTMTHQKIERLFITCCAAALAACQGAGSDYVQAALPALDGADAGQAGAAAALHDANGACVGEVVFTSEAELTRVEISAHMPPGHSGLHAIHIHANDNPANGDGCLADPTQPASTYFVSADGHYNPSGDAHGHHAGDLPALFFTDSGVASLSFLTDRFHLDEILGSAVILHELSDNDGNIPVGDQPEQYTPNTPAATDLTARTGNAGARIACGVVE
jgi:Cu-Zn family superoxide dismutase